MNNDLEQFSEERLMKLIDFSDSPALVSLARIVLEAKQTKPVAWITWHQGFRAPDDCEDYLNAYTHKTNEKSVDGSDAFPVYTSPLANSPAIPDGWIKCSDRMPEELDKNYQVVALSVKKYDEGNYIGEPKKTIVQDWVIRLHPLNFTHWMPLPAAPKPESE